MTVGGEARSPPKLADLYLACAIDSRSLRQRASGVLREIVERRRRMARGMSQEGPESTDTANARQKNARARLLAIPCAGCDHPFLPARRNQRYCTAACWARASRRRRTDRVASRIGTRTSRAQ
jgi:hypothetical protein